MGLWKKVVVSNPLLECIERNWNSCLEFLLTDLTHFLQFIFNLSSTESPFEDVCSTVISTIYDLFTVYYVAAMSYIDYQEKKYYIEIINAY